MEDRAHDLCKSMIEMVSDNTAMQSVPNESMYVQAWIVTHLHKPKKEQ